MRYDYITEGGKTVTMDTATPMFASPKTGREAKYFRAMGAGRNGLMATSFVSAVAVFVNQHGGRPDFVRMSTSKSGCWYDCACGEYDTLTDRQGRSAGEVWAVAV